MSSATLDTQHVEHATRRWLNDFIIAHNVCPFAHKVASEQRIKFSVSDATQADHLLQELNDELNALSEKEDIDTTLLIHPNTLTDFFEFNDFLATVDDLLDALDLHGVFQIASFHPDYQFAGTEFDDAENFTNRSPFPTLHILREDSVSLAVDAHPNPDGIPDDNIERMRAIGAPALRDMIQQHLTAPTDDT